MAEKYDGPPPQKAPVVQVINSSLSGLEELHGVAIRQVTQISEAAVQALTGLPFEKANKYKVGALPQGKRALHRKGDKDGWKPTMVELNEMPTDLFGLEQSSFGQRFLLGLMGAMNLRPFTMNFQLPDGSVGFSVQRPFNLGGVLCCPHKANVFQGNIYVGKVEEDMKCGKNYCNRYCQQACCCTFYYDLYLGEQKRYSMPVNMSCCGHHNNCFGATCCVNDMLWNVYDSDTQSTKKDPVGYIQKTYGGGNCSAAALGRLCFQFNNYVIEFPKNASPEEKMLFMAAFVNTEYVYFEKTGDN